MNRRDLLKAAGIVGAGALATAGYALYGGGSGTGRASTSITTTSSYISSIASNPDVSQEYVDFLVWMQDVSRPYAGTVLNIDLQDEPDYRALQNMDVDFYNVSGINSQYNINPYVINLEETTAAVSTQSPSVDLIDFDSLDATKFNNHLIPPATLAEMYPDITYQNFSMDDFLSAPKNLISTYPAVLPNTDTPAGTTFCLPFNTPVMLEYYRTDIYNNLGLSVAQTWDDYFTNVSTIGSDTNIFGCDSQGTATTPILHEFTNHLYSFGGSLFEINGNDITPTVNTPENVAALENFAKYYKYTCPNALTNDWEGCVTDMCHGLAANAITFEDYAVWVDNPLLSIEGSNMSYATNPAGPSGSFSTYVGDGLGISQYSKHPEAAWIWLQWATCAGTQLQLVANTATRYVPSRASVVNSTTFQNQMKNSIYYPVQLTEQILNSGNIGYVSPFATSDAVFQTIAEQILYAWEGQTTAQEALNTAQGLLSGNSGPNTYNFLTGS